LEQGAVSVVYREHGGSTFPRSFGRFL